MTGEHKPESGGQYRRNFHQGIKIQSKIAESYAIATTVEKNLILSSIFPENSVSRIKNVELLE